MAKDMIFVHTLAVKPDWMVGSSVQDKTKEVKRWHVEDNGWRDIAYAVVIDRDGARAWGRDIDNDGDVWEETAAAAKGYNVRGVHVALVGGFGSNANDEFEDHYTYRQDVALRATIAEIENHFGKKMWVRGHNEVANKACPGFQVKDWYENKRHRSKAGSKTLQATAAGGASVATAGATAVSQLDGSAQQIMVVALVIAAIAFAVIFRERIKKWARGIK